jgi:hypothetical protein
MDSVIYFSLANTPCDTPYDNTWTSVPQSNTPLYGVNVLAGIDIPTKKNSSNEEP